MSTALAAVWESRQAATWRGLRIGVVGWRLIVLLGALVLWHLASIPARRLLLPSPLEVIPAFVDELISQLLKRLERRLAVWKTTREVSV